MNAAAPEPAAPGHVPDVAGLPMWRRALRQGAGYIAPNTIFLVIPAWFAWGTMPVWQFALLIVVLVVTALVLLGSTIAVEWSEKARWAWVGLLLGLIVGIAIITDHPSTIGYFNAFVGACVAMLLPWPMARIVLLCTTLLGLGIAWHEHDLFPAVLALMGLVIGFNVGKGLANDAMEQRLREAEERTAVMAVAAERERIGRDLHDILGHSLTTVAIKADLAGRLIGRSDDAARAEIEDVASVARQALADVRSTVSGMREVRLASELATARSVLKAAGIRVEASSATPSLPDDESELLGFVLREAVTNVLRHSSATTCRISLGEDLVEVSDDGVGISSTAPRSGLRGVEQRLDARGWTLTVEGRGGTTVRAERAVR